MSLQDDMKSAVTRLLADMSLFYDIMHSGPTVSLVLDGQSIPSLRKLFTDLQLNIPNINAKLADHETRIQNAEAALGTGANTNLLNDIANVRNTRSWAQPGVAIGTWTANIAAVPSAAASLLATDTIQLVNVGNGGGKALRLIGAATVGPIPLDRIEADDVLSYRFVLSRQTDDTTTPANNSPVLALQAFSFAQNSLGTVNFVLRAPPEPLPATVASLTAIGDSITVGRNASSNPKQWVDIVGANLKAGTINNRGVSGTVLQNSFDASGAPRGNNGRDRYSVRFSAPYFAEMAIIAYGFNDARYVAAPSTFNVEQYRNDYREVLNGVIALGYARNRIIVVTPHYITDVGLNTGSEGFAGQTRAKFEEFVQAARDIAGEFGVYLADSYSRMRDNGGAGLISSDNIHPNDLGHSVIADAVMAAVRQPLAQTLLNSDGIKFFDFKVSRIPGQTDVALPVGTVYLRPLVGNLGGALNVISAGQRRVTPELPELIDGGTQFSDISDLAKFGFGVDGDGGWATFADLVKAIQGKLDPMVYTETFNLTVDTVSQILLPEDPDLLQVDWQGPGITVGYCPTGQQASLAMGSPTVVAYDGGGGTVTFGEAGAPAPTAFIADRASPITVSVKRKTPGRPIRSLFADNLMGFWPDQGVDPRFRAAMRTALNGAQSDGLLAPLWFMYLCGHSEANDAINLMDPGSGKTLTYNRGPLGLVTTPYGWVKGEGDSYIDTNRTPSDNRFTANSHTLYVAPGSTAIDANGVMLSHSNSYYLTPQLTATKARVKTGSGADDFNAAPGSHVAIVRRNANDYDQFVNGDLLATVGRVNASGDPSSTLRLLANPITGGVNSWSKIPLRMAFAGSSFNSPASIKKLYNWFAPVLAVCDDVRAGSV